MSTCHDTITRAPRPSFVKDPVGGDTFHMGRICASSTTTPSLRHNGTLAGVERAQMRVQGSQTHTSVDKLHPRLSTRECLSRPTQSAHD